MEVSVYISDRVIQAVVGEDRGSSIRIEGCYSSELPPEIIVGGAVQKPEELNAAVADFFAASALPGKTARLAAYSPAFVLRTAVVPNLPASRLSAITENEISDGLAGMDNPVIDYMTLGKPREEEGIRVLIAAAERENLLRYKAAVAAAGKTVRLFDAEPSCAMKLVRRIRPLCAGNFVIVLLSRREMATTLYLDGAYSFAERVKLYEERGTPASAVEISRAMGRFMQFYAAQRLGERLDAAYLCGLTGQEEEYRSDIELSLGISVRDLPHCSGIVSRYMEENRISYGDYLCCIGNLTDQRRSIAMLGGCE